MDGWYAGEEMPMVGPNFSLDLFTDSNFDAFTPWPPLMELNALNTNFKRKNQKKFEQNSIELNRWEESAFTDWHYALK